MMPTIVNQNDVPWFEADLPRLLHKCKTQTSVYGLGSTVGRCACGATRIGGYWSGKNETRRGAGYARRSWWKRSLHPAGPYRSAR